MKKNVVVFCYWVRNHPYDEGCLLGFFGECLILDNRPSDKIIFNDDIRVRRPSVVFMTTVSYRYDQRQFSIMNDVSFWI